MDALGGDFPRARPIEIPAVGLIGVLDPEEGPEMSPAFEPPLDPSPSPSRTRVSIDFSRFPDSPFNTAAFLCSSLNPMSRKVDSFPSRSSWASWATDEPNTRDGLLLGGEGDLRCDESKYVGAAACLDFEDNGKIEDADLNPNLPPVFGGRGGGSSEPVLLPVLFRAGGLTAFS